MTVVKLRILARKQNRIPWGRLASCNYCHYYSVGAIIIEWSRLVLDLVKWEFVCRDDDWRTFSASHHNNYRNGFETNFPEEKSAKRNEQQCNRSLDDALTSFEDFSLQISMNVEWMLDDAGKYCSINATQFIWMNCGRSDRSTLIINLALKTCLPVQFVQLQKTFKTPNSFFCIFHKISYFK